MSDPLTREVDLFKDSADLAREWAAEHTKERTKPLAEIDPRSSYAPYRIPGGGYDYEALERDGFDVS